MDKLYMTTESKAEMSYTNEEGNLVFTSTYLKNRGTCCKTACLHCPYGFTTKKLGLQFREVAPSEEEKFQKYLSFSSAPIDLTLFPAEHRQWVLLKDHICGVVLKNHIVIKHLILDPHFESQGISKELVESYYFC
jgi:hypothetical protein